MLLPPISSSLPENEEPSSQSSNVNMTGETSPKRSISQMGSALASQLRQEKIREANIAFTTRMDRKYRTPYDIVSASKLKKKMLKTVLIYLLSVYL